ncbi:LOW QUALITY PROTEIN: hydroxysteroid 11-beta-dehydrogenase 1-like protein [Molossus nigricans]
MSKPGRSTHARAGDSGNGPKKSVHGSQSSRQREAELFERDPGRAMKVLLFTGLGALFFTYYWADNFNPTSLHGACVLLTRASAGVGKELAYHYARLGSHLVLTAYTEALLQKLRHPFQVLGNSELGAPKVFYIAADMASHEVPEHRVQFALDKLGGLDYLVLNHLGAAPAGTWTRSVHRTSWLMQVLRHSSALPPSLPGRVPTSFSNPYSAAKFALDSFFGSLQRELDVQNVNVAITMCILGLRDHASAAEGVRDVTRLKATLGPKAALVVICGGATHVFHVFCPWRFHMLCLLQTWLPHSKAWFIHQELSVTAIAAA